MNQRSVVEKKKIILPKHNFIFAMFCIAPRPWIAMSSTWGVFIVSLILSWEVPSSGAVLVCGALISEIFYQNQRWTKMNTDPSGSFNLKPDSSTGSPVIWGQFVIAPAGTGKLGILLSLAKGHEVRNSSNDEGMVWHYKNTVERIEKVILTAIVFTAVVGTIVWGYGHLIF